MTSTSFIALVFGAYFVTVAIPMLYDQARLIRVLQNLYKNPAIIFLTGILVMIGGLSVIAFHNIWVGDWRSFISLLGWLAAIKGALLLISPDLLIRYGEKILGNLRTILLLGFLYLGVGIFLLSRALF